MDSTRVQNPLSGRAGFEDSTRSESAQLTQTALKVQEILLDQIISFLSILIVNQSANLQRSTGHKNSEEHKCHVSQSLFLKNGKTGSVGSEAGNAPKAIISISRQSSLFFSETKMMALWLQREAKLCFEFSSNFRSRFGFKNRNTIWQVIDQTTAKNY